MQHRELADLDRELVKIVSGVKVLSRLSWPRSTQDEFLARWAQGKQTLPRVEYQQTVHDDRIAALRALQRKTDRQHPLGRYLHDTAQAYITMCRLLENAGSPRATPFSMELYGRPGDSLAGGTVSNVDAAQHFLEVAADYVDACPANAIDASCSAADVKDQLQLRLNEVFGDQRIAVELDANLVSKAAAGASRIRIRDATRFSNADVEQLLQHEAFVHTLTAINGKQQPVFSSMGLGAPRTTGTQEGLATFAELVTGAIDIQRLARIAQRIVAIDMALNGADFIEVFGYFLEVGQIEAESFNSAMRVYRGAPLTGGSAFTKDTVYLHGLMEVHTFFRWCLRHRKLAMARLLFAGRMTIGDIVRLEPFFASGELLPPRLLPPWIGRSNALSAYLAFSVFANQIRIDALDEGFQFDGLSDISA